MGTGHWSGAVATLRLCLPLLFLAMNHKVCSVVVVPGGVVKPLVTLVLSQTGNLGCQLSWSHVLPVADTPSYQTF